MQYFTYPQKYINRIVVTKKNKEKIGLSYSEISFDTSGASYTMYPKTRREINGTIKIIIHIVMKNKLYDTNIVIRQTKSNFRQKYLSIRHWNQSRKED